MSIADLAILFGCDTVVSQGGGEVGGNGWHLRLGTAGTSLGAVGRRTPFFNPAKGVPQWCQAGVGLPSGLLLVGLKALTTAAYKPTRRSSKPGDATMVSDLRPDQSRGEAV